MAPDSPLEDVKYCFGTFHDRPLATFRDDGSYIWNRALVHECRTCEHISPCFFISTQLKMSKDESLGRGRDQRDRPRQDHGHHHHPGLDNRDRVHHDHHRDCNNRPDSSDSRRKNQGPPRKDVLDILGDFVQVLKDNRG